MRGVVAWAAVLAVLASGCGTASDEKTDQAGGRCCAYERRTVSSVSTSAWSTSCTCSHGSCSEVSGDQSCSGGSCVTTEVRSVREVDDCAAVLAVTECQPDETRCTSGNKYQTCRSGKWSSEKSCYNACYPSDGWCSGGSCVCD